ncbi:hypothetical protein HanXRQr2_Chr08g0351041 [Helianthus annuus]|uniref:Uncharacterized protein n=1 Tax=Helianthus annuus TaxID=4232 RepID=A0A9K3IGE1_HELAN|nr:hypothetical protein HanXRQr2_Chr08g0351041 [Helianthus annuus]
MCFVISRVCLWSFVSVKTLIDRRNRQKFFTIWFVSSLNFVIQSSFIHIQFYKP